MWSYKKIVIALSLGVFAFSEKLTAQEPYSWLGERGQESSLPVDEKIDKVLKPLSGSVRLLDCRYQESLLKELKTVNSRNKDWEYSCEVSEIEFPHSQRSLFFAGEKEKSPQGSALSLSFKFKRIGETIESSGVAFAFDFDQWREDNYVLIPSSVYNGNRNRIVERSYGTGMDRKDMYRKDLPLTTTSVPQLSPRKGTPSRVEVHTSNTATPSICFFNRERKHAFILLAEQGIEVNKEMVDNGFIVEENPERTRASLVVSIPGVRSQKPEFVGFSRSPDRGITWKTGEERSVKLHLYAFPTEDVTGLLDVFMSVRKSLTGANQPRNIMPSSEVLKVMTANIDRRFYADDTNQFYCPENAEWISFGWIGGLMNTFPMLALGDAEHRERVKATFDFGLGKGAGESGYFYGALNKDGKVFGREGYDDFPEVVLTRKNADLLFWLTRQFLLLKEQGHSGEIKKEWEDRVVDLADAFVKTWKKEGQWGNFLNNKTGEIAIYNTSGGVMAIGGLTLASQYFSKPEYLRIAQAAAHYYYGEFLKQGMTTGACADILQNADSETAIALTTSLMTLYEVTGERHWLEKSSDLANLSATWTASFDYRLPVNTPLGKNGAKLTGAVWASTQNKHSAPGFCTQSGDAIFKLYRATGDLRYADFIRDVKRAHVEGIQLNGQISERLTYCDADSRGALGGKTGWNETNGALMALEIPGIYLRTDGDLMYCFDSVNVKLVKRGEKEIVLEISNPTAYDAHVSVFAESEEESQNPMGNAAFLRWRKAFVKAGETIPFRINLD